MNAPVAVVTGAGGGLGASVAEELARAGAELVLLDVSMDALGPICDTLEQTTGMRPVAIACDVSDADRVDAVQREVEERVGPCTVLVNNAAVYLRAPLEEHSLELWDTTLSVNLRGYFLCTRAFGRSMIAQRSGSIVNVSSIAAQGPTPGAVSYCVSKAAIIALTRQTALEWGGYGVRANAVSPGFMSTPMSSAFGSDDLYKAREQRVPVGRVGTTAEVARVIGFLAGPDASFISGVNVTVDGGLTQTLSQTFPRP
ncbi:MAG: short-chain dehydrogenase/reductase [Actinomycetia bacterium]|nr:short-chain dehydrogenase/reductase [Actinomycetes bacterium]